MEVDKIKENIEKTFDIWPNNSLSNFPVNIQELFNKFLFGLNTGIIRAAEKMDDKWITNLWVKKGILLLFRFGTLIEIKNNNFTFFEKNTIGLKKITLNDEVRIVPGGSFIRDGSFIGKGVICMSPMYVNIGAYIDNSSLIDSNALVGTCAQIGKNVHISAGTQIGGVLEPIGANPVIVEDNVLLGGSSGIYEGVIIKQNAVISSGVILNSSTKVYDLVYNEIIESNENNPLIIPENAVVVQGTRGIKSEWGIANNLSISTPLIIKYRDNKTNYKIKLEKEIR